MKFSVNSKFSFVYFTLFIHNTTYNQLYTLNNNLGTKLNELITYLVLYVIL